MTLGADKMDANQDPNVPGQQVAAETPEPVSPSEVVETQATPEHGSRAQERIRELVAQREAERRANAEKDATIARLLAMVDNTAPRAPAAPPVDPYEGFVDEDRQKIDRVLQAKLSPLEKKLATYEKWIEQQQAAAVIRQAAPQAHPEVQALAEKYMSTWVSKGFTGWRPEDAIVFAQGQLFAEGKLTPAAPQPRAANGQYAASASHVTSTQSAPPAPPARTGKPANFDSLHPDKQLEILERELDGKVF
jgi:hypothetical protein